MVNTKNIYPIFFGKSKEYSTHFPWKLQECLWKNTKNEYLATFPYEIQKISTIFSLENTKNVYLIFFGNTGVSTLFSLESTKKANYNVPLELEKISTAFSRVFEFLP